jgi:hypothetical protein
LPLLTLTTCNPRYSASTRLVVTALLAGAKGDATSQVDPPGAASSSSTGSGHRTSSSERRTTSEEFASDSSSGGDVGEAFLWGELTLLIFFGVRIFWRMMRNPARWGVLSVGSLTLILCMFVFFEHVSLALPASF